MSTQNRENTEFEQEEVFLLQDLDVSDADALSSEEPAPVGGSPRRETASRFGEDKYAKNLDATQIYLNEIGFSPLLSAEEEVYFARKALKGEEAARKRMIDHLLQRACVRHLLQAACGNNGISIALAIADGFKHHLGNFAREGAIFNAHN